MNIHVQVFMWTSVFISLGWTSRSGIAGLYGNSLFSLWRTAKQSEVLPPVYIPTSDESSSFCTSSSTVGISIIFTVAILVGVKWCLIDLQ